jgi:hypothetical protein
MMILVQVEEVDRYCWDCPTNYLTVEKGGFLVMMDYNHIQNYQEINCWVDLQND